MTLLRNRLRSPCSGCAYPADHAVDRHRKRADPAHPQDYPRSWDREFPLGDFSRSIVDYSEILSGGPPRDGIPAIDAPTFVSIAEAAERYTPTEPVIGLEVNGEARAYPLQVLTWHEIANDVIGGVPVTVTYCPLCNAAIVFGARNGAAHSFGVSGRLRKSD